MYIRTIILCQQLGITVVADGARISQKFTIEQKEMLDLFQDLFQKYNINILFPVENLNDDFQEKNELLIRGFIPKVLESQCLLGMPLENNSLDEETLNSTIKVYKELLFAKIDPLINRYAKINFSEEYI